MPLLVKESDKFEIEVRYLDDNANGLRFLDPKSTDGVMEVFVFRSPNWKILNGIMMESLLLSANGNISMNPFVFEDLKIKRTLIDWTLKDENGKKLPVNDSNMEKLHPSLWEYLSRRIDPYVSHKANDVVSDMGSNPSDDKNNESNRKDDHCQEHTGVTNESDSQTNSQ